MSGLQENKFPRNFWKERVRPRNTQDRGTESRAGEYVQLPVWRNRLSPPGWNRVVCSTEPFSSCETGKQGGYFGITWNFLVHRWFFLGQVS